MVFDPAAFFSQFSILKWDGGCVTCSIRKLKNSNDFVNQAVKKNLDNVVGIVYREVQSYSVTKTRKKNTVSPLHMNLKLQTVKDATEHSVCVRRE